jgi:hypothetical protein
MIAKLKAGHGTEGARAILAVAAAKQDAREWIAAVINGKGHSNGYWKEREAYEQRHSAFEAALRIRDRLIERDLDIRAGGLGNGRVPQE